MKKISYILFLILFITSCTIQKRLHMPGYYVKWNKNIEQEGSKNQNNDNVATNENLEYGTKNETINQIDEYEELKYDSPNTNQENEVSQIEQSTIKTDTKSNVYVKNNVKTKSNTSKIKTLNSIFTTNHSVEKSHISFKDKRFTDKDLLLLILCFLLPPIAVGFMTNWDLLKVLICLLLCFIFWLPGVVFALLVLFNVF